MDSSKGKKWYVPLLVIVTLTIVFGITYYVSTDGYKERLGKWREANDAIGRPVQSKVIGDQVVLRKDQKLVVGRNALVYKGVDDKIINMDLYLLDLDPEQPFSKRFSTDNAKKQMLLGEAEYKLLSVNDTSINLKIIRTSYAP